MLFVFQWPIANLMCPLVLSLALLVTMASQVFVPPAVIVVPKGYMVEMWTLKQMKSLIY